MAFDRESAYFELLKAEFDSLKNEQHQRIIFRDNLYWYNAAAIGTSIGMATTSRIVDLLVLIPLSTFVFGWLFLMYDVKVSHIGEYLRMVLSPRLYSLLASDETFAQRMKGSLEQLRVSGRLRHGIGIENTAFLWEYFHADDAHRETRKRTQKRVDLVSFSILGVVSSAGLFLFRIADLIFDWNICPSDTWLFVLSSATLLLLLAANVFLFRQTDRYLLVDRHSSTDRLASSSEKAPDAQSGEK